MKIIKNITDNKASSLFIKKANLSLHFLSNDITIESYHFDKMNFKEELFQTLGVSAPHTIKNSVIKRQAEYLAGRFSAFSALQKLGFVVDDIPTGKHRNPIWPQGVVASITHSDTIAICGAANSKNYKYLGIDIENRLSSELVAEIKSTIINEQEETLLKNSTLSFADAFTLVFSAKESLFKALYPSVRYYFDFTAAQVTDICEQNNSFTIILLQDLTPELTAGSEFSGYFTIDEANVLTIIVKARSN